LGWIRLSAHNNCSEL